MLQCKSLFDLIHKIKILWTSNFQQNIRELGAGLLGGRERGDKNMKAKKYAMLSHGFHYQGYRPFKKTQVSSGLYFCIFPSYFVQMCVMTSVTSDRRQHYVYRLMDAALVIWVTNVHIYSLSHFLLVHTCDDTLLDLSFRQKITELVGQ